MKILVVDDEAVNIEILNDFLLEEGYDTITANNGLEAFSALNKHPDISLILLDLTMPVMGGLEFMRQFKTHSEFANIAVIMQTAIADNDSIAKGINAGAYYYLTKPYKKNVLLSVINSALTDARYKLSIVEEMQKGRRMLGLLNHASFELRTMEEAQNLAYFIASSFPDPERVVLGLSEVILNAVEHGNLGISYQEKGELMTLGKLIDEITHRAALPENRNKTVQVHFEKCPTEVKVTVRDQGNGFNWRDFLEMHPDRATDPNGRGIIMARMMSFDNMEYIGCGNEVCCTVKTGDK